MCETEHAACAPAACSSRLTPTVSARWDSGGGQALDTALKDDGPKQLQMAMLVLATVAGGIICGGAGVVACCWQGRERGWSSATAADAKEKFKGQGAQWLEMPV